MLFHCKLLDEYLKILKAQRWISGEAFEWIESTKELRIKTRPFKIGMLACGLVFICRMLHIVGSTNDTQSDRERGNQKRIESLLGIMFSALSFLITHFCVEMVRHKGTVEQLFAGLGSFENRYCPNGTGLCADDKRMLKSAKKTCAIMRELGVKSTPFTLALVAVTLPKLPFNVLSMPPASWIMAAMETSMIQVGISKMLTWITLKAILFCFNLWFWILTYGIGIIMTNQIIIGTNSMTVAISMFQRQLQKQSGVISGDVSQKAIQMYREIQLLSCYFNQVHELVVISMLSTAIIGQVVSVLGLVSGAEDGNADSKATTYFVMMVYLNAFSLCGICINFIYGFCGTVNYRATKCVDNLNHQENLYGNKIVRRMIRCLPGIKINLGRTNYIEKITPVVYQQFTNEKIVDTLILRSI